MATAIRLARRGSKKHPTYRIVVADSRRARDGRFIESIGFYNPQSEPSVIEVDEAKAEEWLKNGAQPSDTVRKLFSLKGIV
jgi:small subunit ribosomal protein S16